MFAISQYRDVLGPREQVQSQAEPCLAAAIGGHWQIGVFVRVAVRAVMDAFAVERGQIRYGGQEIDNAGGEQKKSAFEMQAFTGTHREASGCAGDARDKCLAELNGISADVVSGDRQELRGMNAVAGEEVVDVPRGVVAGVTGVEHKNRASATTENDCRAEPGSAAPNNDRVVDHVRNH